MPELEIQHRERSGVPGWLWLVGLVLLALIIWGVYAAMTNNRTASNPPSNNAVAGSRQQLSDRDMLPAVAILDAPGNYYGQTVSGVATVTDVISDRGFWVENGGRRVFVILGAGIPEAGVNIETGQRVTLTGTFMEGNEFINQTGADALEQDARQAIEAEAGFIRAEAVDILQPKQE